MDIPRDWKDCITGLFSIRGRVLTLGGTDTGKTTFCRIALNALRVRQISCAFVDTDIGQSEIGPPCTVGWANIENHFDTFTDLIPSAIRFVGSTSPAGCLPESILAAQQIVCLGEESGADVILVDAPGYVLGSGGRRFTQSLIGAVRPDIIVAIQSDNELEPVLSGLKGLRSPKIVRLKPSERVRRRSLQERAGRRQLLFAGYFSDIEQFEIDCGDTGISRCGLFSGSPLDAVIQDEVRSAGLRLVYGEQNRGRINIVVVEKEFEHLQERLTEIYADKEINVLHSRWFNGLLVGLADEYDSHRAMGIIREMDFNRKICRVMVPTRRLSWAKKIIPGFIRVAPNGVEIGKADPYRMADFRVLK